MRFSRNKEQGSVSPWGRPSPALAVSMVALFVAMGGSAFAVKGAVTSKDIKRNAVHSKHIKRNAVRSRHIMRNAVKSVDIKNGNLSGKDIRAGSLGADLFDADTRAELRGPRGARGLRGPQGETGPPGSSELSFYRETVDFTAAPNDESSGVATCDSGDVAVSGGFYGGEVGVVIRANARTSIGNAWMVQVTNEGGTAVAMDAFAVCLRS